MQTELIASGSYLPRHIVTNDDLAKKMTTSDAWIREHIGVTKRRFAEPGEGVSDMALQASLKALHRAGMEPTGLDAIVFATTTPEHMAPGGGALLQQKLGCRDIPAFDVRNTSPGFIFALDLTDGLIKSGRYKTVLVVGSEVHSSVLDFTDNGRKMAVIFGDGCGCFLLRASKSRTGFRDFVLHTDGSGARHLWWEKAATFPQMDGKVVFENAVTKICAVAGEILTRNHLTEKDIDLFIVHQANLRILEAVRERLKLCDNKLPHNIEKYGNTSSAAIPILFDELHQDGRIRAGQKIVFLSFGSGFSWGAGLLEM